MHSGKPFEFLSLQKVYRPSPRCYLKHEVLTTAFAVVSIGFMLLMMLVVTQPPEQKLPLLLVLLPLLVPLEVLLVFYFLWWTQVRLVTSAEGIAYSTIFYHIFTPWDNVAGLDVEEEWFSGGDGGDEWSRVISGLKLHQPAPFFKVRPWVRFLHLEHLIDRTDYNLFIPVSNVVENWQHSEVAEDIRRYAPQVEQHKE